MSGSVESGFGKRISPPLTTTPPPPRSIVRPDPLRTSLSRGASRERVAGLDLLRLFAAFAVILFHFGYAGPMRGWMDPAIPALAQPAKFGFFGVELFFLISGFVITASAVGRSWREFALSRFLRLYPAFVVCMTTTAMILVALGGVHPVTFPQWLANLSMVSPALGQPFMDGAYWSIVVEIVFYGWVGLLVALGLFERRLLTILSIWLALAFLNEMILHSRALKFALCTDYAAYFASGILIQRLFSGDTRALAKGLLVVAFVIGGLHAFEHQQVFARLYSDTASLPVLLALHTAVYALFVAALRMSSRIPASPLVLALGGLTYPLYLIHQEAGEVMISRLAPVAGGATATVTVIALALAFAYWVSSRVEPAARAALKPILAPLVAWSWPRTPSAASAA